MAEYMGENHQQTFQDFQTSSQHTNTNTFKPKPNHTSEIYHHEGRMRMLWHFQLRKINFHHLHTSFACTFDSSSLLRQISRLDAEFDIATFAWLFRLGMEGYCFGDGLIDGAFFDL